MEKTFDTHPVRVTIKNEIPMIGPVQSAARTYATFLGFKNKECFHIELILEELLTNIIKFDFIPGKKEDINITFEKTTLGVSVTIHSLSVPLDIERINSFRQVNKEHIAHENASGLGSLLINSFADSVTYSNRGKLGQFIVIEKNLPYDAVSEFDRTDLATGQTTATRSDFKFYVRRLKPDEAYSISQLAYYTYNISYIYDKIYYPDKVRRLNEEGEMISVVAVNEENEDIIGHVAAVQHDQSGLPELAVGFVNPNYRGGGCLQKGSEFLLALLKSEGRPGVIAQAVTAHPFSQKAAYKLGLRETATFISRVTPLEMNDIREENQIRDSLLFMYQPLHQTEIRDVFVPRHHASIVKKIYENVDVPVNIITKHTAPKQLCDSTELEVSADGYSCGHIAVKQYASTAAKDIDHALKTLCVSRTESVYLYLPLANPETAEICTEVEQLGFFFGGVIPAADGNDLLLLQFLNNQKYEYDSINVFSDFGKELIGYIRSSDPSEKY